MRLLILFLLLSLGAEVSNAQIIRANAQYVPLGCSGLLLDCYPNAAAAYSLRKLRNAYTGNAIRVRRKSDNAEQNIGFSNNNLDTASLKTFIGTSSTDTGWVVTWYDQTINARDITQATASRQPRIYANNKMQYNGNMPTILFDGLNDGLQGDGFSASDFSAFTFINLSASLNDVKRLFQLRSSATNSVVQFAGQGTLSQIGMPKGISSNVRSSALSNNIKYLFSFISNDKIFKNGSDDTNSNFQTGFGVGSGTNITLGNRSDFNASTGFAGLISEFIFYDSDQSSNRTGIETNINSYYGIW